MCSASQSGGLRLGYAAGRPEERQLGKLAGRSLEDHQRARKAAASLGSSTDSLLFADRDWLDDPVRTDEDRVAFAELLLQLDADPVGRSTPVLKPGTPPGVRSAMFGARRVIFVLDLASGDLHMVSCHE